jgi:hypothetical protein
MHGTISCLQFQIEQGKKIIFIHRENKNMMTGKLRVSNTNRGYRYQNIRG